MPTGLVPAGRSAVGIMLVDRSRRPSSEAERRRLSAAVMDRGWSLSVRFGAGAVLAELCQVDREEAAREAWGLPRRFDLVLLIAGGVSGEERDVFVRAVRAHASRTRIHGWNGHEIIPIDGDEHPGGDDAPSGDARAADRADAAPGAGGGEREHPDGGGSHGTLAILSQPPDESSPPVDPAPRHGVHGGIIARPSAASAASAANETTSSDVPTASWPHVRVVDRGDERSPEQAGR